MINETLMEQMEEKRLKKLEARNEDHKLYNDLINEIKVKQE